MIPLTSSRLTKRLTLRRSSSAIVLPVSTHRTDGTRRHLSICMSRGNNNEKKKNRRFTAGIFGFHNTGSEAAFPPGKKEQVPLSCGRMA